jgi:hypothetical protein
MKIDIKFVAGALASVLVIGVVALLLIGNDGSSKGQSQPISGISGVAPSSEPTDDKPTDSPSSEATPLSAGEASALAVPTGGGKVACPSPTTSVSSADELQQALKSAKPGDVIRLAPGTYEGEFVAQTTGTRDKPIFLCGDARSILDGGGIKKGYAFHLDQVDYWRLVGFTIQNSQKGVVGDKTNGSVIQGLTVHNIGDEGIHLRDFSTGNTVQYNKVYDTGQRRAKFGEGIYLGSAQSNWKQNSGGQMDKSDNNVVRGNVIRATAEAIDIKEGTSGGHIVGNVFDGSALGGDKFNDSWVDVKGNKYVIEGNRGKKTPQDGFQTHQVIKGWGTGNIFRNNVIDLDGGAGVGINDTVGGNTIACNNKTTGGRLSKNGKCS